MTTLGMTTHLKGTMEDVRSTVTAALKEQGFGILTEIDVRATLREKLGVEFGAYLILGACNPQIAHQALTVDPSIGLLLPCNVTLRETDGGIEVSIVDPEVMLSVAGPAASPKLTELQSEAKTRLQAALATIERAAAPGRHA
jgi:uncharacterized protein (DUF302 family)